MSAIFLDLAQVVSLISFGALVAFTAVNFSVFMKFYIKDKQRSGFKNKFLNLFYRCYRSSALFVYGSISTRLH